MVSGSILRCKVSCQSLNLLSVSFYFSIVILLENFWAFQFFPIIAEVVTFELDGLYTRYGEGRAMMTLPLSGPLPYSGLAFGVGVDVSDCVWSGENPSPRKHSR